eukprot:PRCOL_00004398-RA
MAHAAAAAAAAARGRRDATRRASPRAAATGRDGSAVGDASLSRMPDPGLNAELLSLGELSVSRPFDSSRGGDWEQYQSPRRYVDQLRSLPQSVITRRIAPLCSGLFAWAAAVAAAHSALGPDANGLLVLSPAGFGAFTTLGGAVSLLLVFRTNSAYARFCAGRDGMARVTAHARNAARKCAMWFPRSGPADEERRRATGRLLSALPWALKARAQGIERLEGGEGEVALRRLLSAGECARVLDAPDGNAPRAILSELSSQLAELEPAGVHPIGVLLIDNDLTALHEELAALERLVQTPTPLTYTRHTSRSLMLWLVALPLATVETLGWKEIPLDVLVSYLLLGIDDCGMQIEQPFVILPMLEQCTDIEAAVRSELPFEDAGDS